MFVLKKSKWPVYTIIVLLFIMLIASILILNANRNVEYIETELNSNIVGENSTSYPFSGTISLKSNDPYVLIEIQENDLYKKELNVFFYVHSTSKDSNFTTNEIRDIKINSSKYDLTLKKDVDYFINENELKIKFNQKEISDYPNENIYIYIYREGDYHYVWFKDIRLRIISNDHRYMVFFDPHFQVSNYNKGDLDVFHHGLRVEGIHQVDYYNVLLHYYPDAYIVMSLFIGLITILSFIIGFLGLVHEQEREDRYDIYQNMK